MKGNDCRAEFMAAYENRYTWRNDFHGYKGNCIYEKNGEPVIGNFLVGSDLKISVNNISVEDVKKLIVSQLWEVVIHRIYRSFEETHALNTFTSATIDNNGIEVIVGGKNEGDKYLICNDIVKMVVRNIHGKKIKIHTHTVFETGNGYLSKSYSSQYFLPSSDKEIGPQCNYTDNYSKLGDNDLWVLSERFIEKESFNHENGYKEKYCFTDLASL